MSIKMAPCDIGESHIVGCARGFVGLILKLSMEGLIVWISKLLVCRFHRLGSQNTLQRRPMVISKLASRQSEVMKTLGPSDASTKI
jgi:hypothetical protein